MYSSWLWAILCALPVQAEGQSASLLMRLHAGLGVSRGGSLSSNAVALLCKSAQESAMRGEQANRVAGSAVPYRVWLLVACRGHRVWGHSVTRAERGALRKTGSVLTGLAIRSAGAQSFYTTSMSADDGLPRFKSQRICQWDRRAETHRGWERTTIEDHQKWGC